MLLVIKRKHVQNDLISILPHTYLATYAKKNKPSILVVEDHPMNRKVIELQLRDNFDVTFAKNGEEALCLCKKEDSFKLILLDMGLPDMSGSLVARKIRQLNNPLRHVPILAHSAYLECLIAQECDQAGINAVLPKPSSVDHMITTIHAWIAKRNINCQ